MLRRVGLVVVAEMVLVPMVEVVEVVEVELVGLLVVTVVQEVLAETEPALVVVVTVVRVVLAVLVATEVWADLVVAVPLWEILALTARQHRHLLENFQPSFPCCDDQTSSLITCIQCSPGGGIGRRGGLKPPFLTKGVWVQVPSRAPSSREQAVAVLFTRESIARCDSLDPTPYRLVLAVGDHLN